jgi:hypothetical protein
VDQNLNPNFRSSLRANVGLVSIERQGGGLDGGATFQSAGNTQDRNSILIAFLKCYSLGKFLRKVIYNTVDLDAIARITTSPQVVVVGTNDETLAILGNPGYVF